MRPEEWQVLNMKVTLILRIVQFSFPNIYSALTVFIYFIFFFFVCVKKETQAVLVQDCEREAASPPSSVISVS